MTTPDDYRAMINELADQLDLYRRCLLDNNRATHPLVERARALLAAPEAVGVTDEELLACMIQAAYTVPDGQAIGITDWPDEAVAAARAVLSRYGTAHPAPVPVGERLAELRGMFERILNKARCMETRTVGNIELSDRLLDAVVDWALPEAQP